MKLTAETVENIEDVAFSLCSYLKDVKIKFVIFSGEMGVGKTTLINSVLKHMDVQDHTSSPTFSIVNEYFSVNYGSIYHFDFYRIKDDNEALDIGVEEIFEEDAYCFIEWPERIQNLLPDKIVRVNIQLEGTTRQFEVSEL